MYKVFIKNTPLVIEESTGEMQLIVNSTVSDKKPDFSLIEDYLKRGQHTIVKGDSLAIFKNLFQNHHKIMAAGGIVFNGNKALFIFRNGVWDLPKGKLEDESVKDCALREVEEECGISNLKIIRELPSTYHTYEMKSGPVLKRTYWFEMETGYEGQLIPQTEEGITDVKWMTVDEFDQQGLETYGAINDLLSIYHR